MSNWSRGVFGSVTREIKELQKKVQELRDDPSRTGPLYAEVKAQDRLVELYHREETMWKQQSRVQWLWEGDKNTHFFHQRATRRKKKNNISNLERLDGSVTEDRGEMEVLARSFYETLYTSEGAYDVDEVLDIVPVKVSDEMNDDLARPFAKEEIRTALF